MPDQKWAEWITLQLESHRYSCIVQWRDFYPSGDFMHLMRDGIRRSRHMLAVLSPDYFASRFATAELNAALAADPLGVEGRLLPVRVREVQPLDFMRTRIYIDLVNRDKHSARTELLQKVEAFKLRTGTSSTHRPKSIIFPGAAGTCLPPTSTIPAPRSAARLLFIGAELDSGLELKQQARKMQQSLERAKKRGSVQFKAKFDVTAEALLDEIAAFEPDILHLSGKQEGGFILFRDRRGGVSSLSDQALAGLIRSLDRKPWLVVLDTCFSYDCARSLVGTIDAAVGVPGSIYDDDAISFYVQFYDALGDGRSVREAAARAKFLLTTRRTKKACIPVLVTRPRFDARSRLLV